MGFPNWTRSVAVAQGQVETTLGAAQSHGADAEPAAVQRSQHVMKPISPGAQDIILGDPAIVKVKFTGVGGPPHEFSVHGPRFESSGAVFHQDAA